MRQRAAVPVDWAKAQNIQLTDAKGTEYFPTLSPDGKIFAYASDANTNFDIYVQRTGSKKAENLTLESTADDTQPAFSPDGERIAFRSEREEKGIYVMSIGGENVRRVADFGYHPSWSPDGKEIVVSLFGRDQPTVRAGGETGLWIINVETGAKRELSKIEASFPAWSPSGKRVAFWYYTGNFARRDIATISTEGGEPITVAKDFAISNWNPVWSPDGKYLYFVSSKGGSMGFWRVAIDEAKGEVSGEPEPVGTLSKFSRHLNFSRDGKRMIYVQTNNQANIQGAGFDMRQLQMVGQPGWITQGDREISRAELSPDGTRYAMRLIKRTQDDIVTYGVENREWRDVTDDASFDRYVRWSPDSKQLAFSSDRGQEGGNIWMSNVDGTNLRQITFPNERHSNFGFPVFAPDGKRMSIVSTQQTYIIDLTKKWSEQTPQPLAKVDGVTGFGCWDWSPDGKKLAGTIYEGEKRMLGFYDLETGAYHRFVESDGNFLPSWLPDSRHLVYSTGREINLIDTETGKERLLYVNSTIQPRSPFVSRDGQKLYYTAHIAESDIWLLDLTQNP
jgi:Tol biopolymer transport system component